MDISADLAAVQARIAQITGGGFVPPVPAALAAPAPEANFSAMVSAAMGQQAPDASYGGPAAAGPALVPPERIEQLVSSNAAAWGVDPALVKAIIANESGFDPNATSRAGAQGLMQLMPQTAAGLGVSDAYDPSQNVWGGTRYIRGLLDRFHGDVPLAVAAYNAGPGAVEKYGGVPPYAETQHYVANVLESYRRYQTQTR